MHGLDQGLARLAVLAGDRHAVAPRQFLQRRDIGRNAGGEVAVRDAAGDRGIGVEHRRADLLVVGVQRHLERFRCRELRQAGIDQTLGRGEMDDHEAVDAAVGLEALQIVLEAVDLVAHRGQVGALAARDIAAELDVADGGPGPDQLQAPSARDPVRRGPGRRAGGRRTPDRPDKGPTRPKRCSGREPSRSGWNRPAAVRTDRQPHGGSFPTRRRPSWQPRLPNRLLQRPDGVQASDYNVILRNYAGHGKCRRQTLLNGGNGQWSGYQTGTFANRREASFMRVTHIFNYVICRHAVEESQFGLFTLRLALFLK